MNAEMYSRIGGKALPEDNLDTVKVINFVDEEGQPVAFGQGAQGPAGPAGPVGPQGPAGPAGPVGPAATVNNATKDTPGLVRQVAHVDSTECTISDLVHVLIDAGVMASS